MTLDEQLDQSLFKLKEKISGQRSVVAEVMAWTNGRMPPGAKPFPAGRTLLQPFGRLRLAIAATILLSVAGFLLIDRQSSSVFANQALAAFQQAKADGVSVKERTIVVMHDGTRQNSSTSDILYVGRDSYRRDIYDNDKLRETQWYTRNGDGMLQTSVRFDTKTYTRQIHKGGFGESDPLERMSLLVKFIDKADRRLEPLVVNGRQCPGFEIRPSQYGSNPKDWVDRIWFDPDSKLPMRIEQERPRNEKELKAFVTVQDQYTWRPNFPTDTFTPKIPDGFTIQK